MKTILIIEDEQSLREETAKTLQCLDFEVIEAANGVQGVEFAKIHQPDLIICDIMMPELDGYGVLSALRQDQETAAIPFVFLSAKADRTDVRQGMNLGADDYLTKPFTLEELSEAITARLEKQAAITQPYLIEMKRAAEQLAQLAYHDQLTNLPNRILLYHHLFEALRQAKRSRQTVTVFCVNIHRFQTINTTLGHAIGDQLLQVVAKRLGDRISIGDFVARLGGDEFSILLINRTEPEIHHFSQMLLSSLAEPYEIEGQEIRLQVNVGITTYPTDDNPPDKLLNHAGIAMRWQGHTGNQCQFYRPEMDTVTHERRLLETSLHHALERSELQVHYQPQINLITGRIIGAEALVRWYHPELGLVSPATFIPLAEENGLIIPLGEWILQTACEQAKIWQTAYPFPVRVAVNLSARQLKQQSLVAMVQHVLAETQLEPSLLSLEFTETSVMEDTESTIETLNQLKQMGAQISIDDFGTGYSSLNYLRRFPIDTLKIDQSFVADIFQDAGSASIVVTIVAMANSLKFKVIAEGVETREQLDFLKQHGCHAMQGFLFSPAVSAADFAELLKDGKRLA